MCSCKQTQLPPLCNICGNHTCICPKPTDQQPESNNNPKPQGYTSSK